MQIQIRQETEDDYSQVFNLIQEAFEQMPHSDHREQFLVERLRESSSFIPEFSLVACSEKEIVGHILLTKIKLKASIKELEMLALAPVSVKPRYQSQGIGSQLIASAHQKAKAAGYQAIALIGQKNYYPRFGYKAASQYDIKFPFEAPRETCMIVELIPGSLKGVKGIIEYPKEFFI